eukprot:GHVT01095073.1.p1 GENE.GHVT01095073.1~~GHVT01095073.1.p1  ORF type:complete len:241 (-),score=40.67 GHVT01095073.1:1192-1914(-)
MGFVAGAPPLMYLPAACDAVGRCPAPAAVSPHAPSQRPRQLSNAVLPPPIGFNLSYLPKTILFILVIASTSSASARRLLLASGSAAAADDVCNAAPVRSAHKFWGGYPKEVHRPYRVRRPRGARAVVESRRSQELISTFLHPSTIAAAPYGPTHCKCATYQTRRGAVAYQRRCGSSLRMIWAVPVDGDEPTKLRRRKIDPVFEIGFTRADASFECFTANALAQETRTPSPNGPTSFLGGA